MSKSTLKTNNADAREEVDIGAYSNGVPREEVERTVMCKPRHPGGGGLSGSMQTLGRR